MGSSQPLRFISRASLSSCCAVDVCCMVGGTAGKSSMRSCAGHGNRSVLLLLRTLGPGTAHRQSAREESTFNDDSNRLHVVSSPLESAA